MEKSYEVMIEVAYTVDAEDADDAKKKAEDFIGELQREHGLVVMFQVGEATSLSDDEDEDDDG